MKTITIERIEREIEVRGRLSVVYNQWTQFEEFPQFMKGVKSVRQIDDQHLAWRAKILGQEMKWDAEITEQVPDERIAWQSTTGTPNKGTVYFTPLSTWITRVTLVLEYEPRGWIEVVGDAFGALSFRIASDLRRFRKFIEEREGATGAWRGHIPKVAVVM